MHAAQLPALGRKGDVITFVSSLFTEINREMNKQRQGPACLDVCEGGGGGGGGGVIASTDPKLATTSE